jgi:hypothetical protein
MLLCPHHDFIVDISTGRSEYVHDYVGSRCDDDICKMKDARIW